MKWDFKHAWNVWNDNYKRPNELEIAACFSDCQAGTCNVYNVPFHVEMGNLQLWNLRVAVMCTVITRGQSVCSVNSRVMTFKKDFMEFISLKTNRSLKSLYINTDLIFYPAIWRRDGRFTWLLCISSGAVMLCIGSVNCKLSSQDSE